MSKISEEPSKEALLSALQAHGQQFLLTFGSLGGPSTQPQRKRRKVKHDSEKEGLNSESTPEAEKKSDDEWHGFSASVSHSEEEPEDEDTDESEGEESEVEDDEFTSERPVGKQPEVVVFSGPSTRRSPVLSKLQAKAFMSSKVSRLREDIGVVKTKEDDSEGDDYLEERSNLQNDALLHKLVHTQLLSGSLSAELNMTPAQKRKALEGRLLELAGGAKLGKGESLVRQDERKKASKRVRLGLEKSIEEQKAMNLEQAKNLGNYHQSIKHLFDASSGGKHDKRKRERGLKLGVGRFSGGVLKLSKDEITAAQGPKSTGPKRGMGRKPTSKRK